MTAAQYGLEVNDARGQAWLIPRRNKSRGMEANFQFGYIGLIDLAGRGGIIVNAFDIHEHDTFVFDQGSGDPPSHTYSLVKDRGEVIATIHRLGKVLTTDYEEEGTRVVARVTNAQVSGFAEFAV
jgi:YD repeat-containing protein